MVNIVTRLWAEQQRNCGSVPGRSNRLSLLHSVQTHISPSVKQLRCEADHSRPSGVKVKNGWSCTSTPPYAFMACRGTSSPLLVGI
jgi:hypothetical protein